MSDIEFHRLEEYDESPLQSTPKVLCSFKTKRFGFVQVMLTNNQRKGNQWNFESLLNEPDLNMFRQREQQYMKQVCAIVWRMVYEIPSMTDRFES